MAEDSKQVEGVHTMEIVDTFCIEAVYNMYITQKGMQVGIMGA